MFENCVFHELTERFRLPKCGPRHWIFVSRDKSKSSTVNCRGSWGEELKQLFGKGNWSKAQYHLYDPPSIGPVVAVLGWLPYSSAR
jgi:hypothetical protein